MNKTVETVAITKKALILSLTRTVNNIISNPGCTVGVILGAMISWDTLGPIIPIAQSLTAVSYLNIIADQVHLIRSLCGHCLWAKGGPTGY
uniref:Uncharacterized protein n=1 Tax=Cyprinus carpio TaxID=7962 RepID=A0A8C1GUD4_CYPCA